MNAAVIGQAAVSAVHEPEAWQQWLTPVDDVLQQIKYLWHALVVFGSERRDVRAEVAPR